MVTGNTRLIRFNTVVVSLLFFILFGGTEGANQELKVLTAAQNNPNVVPSQYTGVTPEASLRNTGLRFKNAARVCVYGMWALYNVANFGEGIDDPSQIQVISIRSTDITQCTVANSITQLTSVASMRFLGAGDAATDAVSIFTDSAFIGGLWSLTAAVAPPATGITGVRMGSLAITGKTKVWRICGDVGCSSAVCVDMSLQTGGLFLVRNTATDTSTSWPKVVRAVQTPTVCDGGDITPPVQIVGGRRKRSVRTDHHRNESVFEVLY